MSDSHITQIAILAGARIERRKGEDARFSLTEAQLIELARMINPCVVEFAALADALERRGLKPILKVD